MNFGPTTYALGLLAGALSTLSPSVLPLVPVVLAAAASAHRWGALALGAGLALSFTLVGLFLATLGVSLGLDPDTFRTVGAVILATFGIILLVPKLQDLFARMTGAVSNSGNQLLSRVTIGGFAGQLIVGAPARCRLESLCGPDARSRDDACQPGEGSRMAEQGSTVKGCGKHVDQEVDVESRIIRASPRSSAVPATSPGSAFPRVPLKAISRVAPLPLRLCAGSPYRARAEPRARP